MSTASPPRRRARLALVLTCLGACEGSRGPVPEATTSARAAEQADATPRERATREVDRYVDGEARALVRAAEGLCTEGVDLTERRARWRRARVHYERIEGAIAVLFPETDADVDGRYEHVAELRADTDALDGEGFVGMHAIERILFADEIAEPVHAFERALTHHAPPTPLGPSDEARFGAGLCARLVRDLSAMEEALDAVALDPETAWRGVLGSVEEQAEKVRLGATGQSESRYAQHTLADMRANLEGGRAVLEAFAGELEALPEGRERLGRLREGFARLEQGYRAHAGDALPEPPPDFDPERPTGESAYGRLFLLLAHESDPGARGALAREVREAGRAMGIAELGR